MRSGASASSVGVHTPIPLFRATVIGVANEIHKGLLQAWSERLQILIELPLFCILFVLFSYVGGRGQEIASGHLDWRLDPAPVSSLLVGYGAFLFFHLQTAKLFWRLLGEPQTGTRSSRSI